MLFYSQLYSFYQLRMTKRNGVFIFLIVLIIHVAGIYIGNYTIEAVTKPLLLIILTVYFIVNTNSFSSGLKKWMLSALFFSWIGDLLLMFVKNNSAFFVAGLFSFLIAHVAYIFFFHAVRVKENIKGNIFLLLPVLIYYAILMTILSPWLGNMKLPVRIYGVVICFMLMLALHMLYIQNKKAGIWMVSGAVLFVISDSVLAVNKFYNPVKDAGIIIMTTYGIAQMLITHGAIKYITGKDKESRPP